MSSLKEELVKLALKKGATNARRTTKERLEGSPSADPASQHILGLVCASKGEDYGVRGVLGRSLEDTNPTCGNCSLVCSRPKEQRKKLVELLHSSGVMVWKDSREVVTNADTGKSQALLQALKETEFDSF